MALSRWVSYGNTEKCDIIKNNIVAVATASVGISKFYEYCVKKAKIENEDVVPPPTNQELDKIQEEEMWEEFGEPDKDTIH